MDTIDITFTATLQKVNEKGGWTYVVWPKASDFFGTRGAVKVRAKIDGYEVKTSFMPMGNGVQMMPVKVEVRQAIAKEAGDTVTVHLLERLS